MKRILWVVHNCLDFMQTAYLHHHLFYVGSTIILYPTSASFATLYAKIRLVAILFQELNPTHKTIVSLSILLYFRC